MRTSISMECPPPLYDMSANNVLSGYSMKDGIDKVNFDSTQVKANKIQLIIWNVHKHHDCKKIIRFLNI